MSRNWWKFCSLGMSLPAFLLCVLIGVALGLGGYTARYAEATSYLSDDPKSCVNCHVMRDVYDGWQKASHHGVATCNDCHTPHTLVAKYLVKAQNGYHHSKAFTFQEFHEPIRIGAANAKVLQVNCVDCHRGLTSTITGHAPAGGDDMSCVRCHASVGHGPPR